MKTITAYEALLPGPNGNYLSHLGTFFSQASARQELDGTAPFYELKQVDVLEHEGKLYTMTEVIVKGFPETVEPNENTVLGNATVALATPIRDHDLRLCYAMMKMLRADSETDERFSRLLADAKQLFTEIGIL